MAYAEGQTAVIVPVPDAEPAVGGWRARFDSSTPFGVPPHVTVVFPFLRFELITSTDLFDLRSLFAGQPPIALTLGAVGQFPGVLYLVPEPVERFSALTAAMTGRWPDALPYGGQFAEVIPHLTVTDSAESPQIDDAVREIEPLLPIRSLLTEGQLIRFDGARWGLEEQLPFGR